MMEFRTDDPPLPGTRVRDDPGVWRDGDDFIRRAENGTVVRWFGYFGDSQVRMRKFMAARLAAELKALL